MAKTRKLGTSLGAPKKRLVLALAAGALAAVLVFLYVGSMEAEARAAHSAALEEYGGTRTEVLVATRDILIGEELSAENTTMMPWLSELLPAGTLTSPEEGYGRAVAVPVWENEPLSESKLGSGKDLIRVPDGLSAVSIPISDDRAVGGSLLPGSSVDVYAVGASQVRLVLADVLVLEASNGAGGALSGSGVEAGSILRSNARATLTWVTLAVLDESVVELLSAARDNTLSLVLPGQNAGAALAESTPSDAEQSVYAEAAEGAGGKVQDEAEDEAFGRAAGGGVSNALEGSASGAGSSAEQTARESESSPGSGGEG